MRKLITTSMLAVMLGVSGLALSACDQGNSGNGDRPGATPTNPNQTLPDQTAPGGSKPGGGGMGDQNGGLGS